MRYDIMVDIETLGTKSDSTIFQIAAIAFDIKTGEHFHTFNKIADISENKSMKVDGSTILWWLNTDKELLTELLLDGDGSSDDLLRDFSVWLVELSIKGKLHLWGNGILFDNQMIKTQFENIGLMYPINYKRDRDVRTIVDLLCAKKGIEEHDLKNMLKDESFRAHDALNDVGFQVKLVTYCYNKLIKDE